MGTLIFWGVIVLGVFLGMVIYSLLSMAKRTNQIYELMYRAEDIATPVKPLYRAAAETLSPTSSGEARPQRGLIASVAAP